MTSQCTDDMNNITERQSNEESIKISAAFRTLYRKAKFWKSVLWTATFSLSFIQVIIALNPEKIETIIPKEDLTSIFVVIALATMLIGTFGKTFAINVNIKKGSDLQRLHDHLVLNLGQKPSNIELRPSKIENLANYWRRNNKEDYINLGEWWPNCVERLPEKIAQNLCLMHTLQWELELRKKYIGLLLIILITLIFTLLLISFNLEMTTRAFVTDLITPASPIFALIITELLASIECEQEAKQGVEEAQNLWRTESNLTEKEFGERLNELTFFWQGVRPKQPPIFDWMYWLTRKTMNENMLIDSEKLSNEYLKNVV